MRCTIGERSIVPDIAVLLWHKISLDRDGEPKDNVRIAPDWTIEILSPGQSSNLVTGNILHCLEYGCQLGWPIDPRDRSVLVYYPSHQPILCKESDRIPVPQDIPLNLTAEQVFDWLKMS